MMLPPMINLKKQSQFSNGKIAVSSYFKGNYVKITPFGAQKNKANSKHALSAVEWANCRLGPFGSGGKKGREVNAHGPNKSG